nr:retrovirus-related Pol polyprotein from transposon TNT 1-94 [Tanacetum cinerariifolium]
MKVALARTMLGNRALHPKWRAKVTTIEESKDFSSLALDELIKAKKEYEERKSLRQREEKKGKSDEKCFRCGDPNYLILDCPKTSRNNDQKAFIGGSWSDSENDAEEKTNDETCLMAPSSNEVCLRTSLEPDEWIKDSGYSKHMTGNKSLFSTYKAYDGGLQIKQIEDEIFFNQSKYIKEMLKKFGLEDSIPTKTPMSTEIKFTKDDEADFVDSSKYREDNDACMIICVVFWVKNDVLVVFVEVCDPRIQHMVDPKKSLSPPQAQSKSISSKSTLYTSSSSPSESPTPTHVAPPPKLHFFIPIKLEPQELPPLQVLPNDPYVQTMHNWPSGPSNPSPPPHVSRPPLGFPNPPPGFKPLPST